jgi:hypothetical protein
MSMERRYEHKDVADVIHFLRYQEDSPESIAAEFAAKLASGPMKPPCERR